MQKREITVRQGGEADVPDVAKTLAAAFAGYVWTDWTVERDRQGDRLRRMFELILDCAVVPFAELWVTDDCAAAAVWVPPGPNPGLSAAFASISDDLRELAGDRADASDRADAEAGIARPSEQHWYLVSMGTQPERQGQGLGSAVLAPILERCDQAGQLAYTETSTPANVAFYRGHGFDTITEIRVSGGGPPVWPMLRRPGPA